MIPILEQERSEHPETVDAFGRQPDLLRHLPVEILFHGFNRHLHLPRRGRLAVGQNVEARGGERAAKGVVEGSVTIRRLGVCVLPRSDLLISLRRKMNMKVAERPAFDVVGVFVTPAVISALNSSACLERSFPAIRPHGAVEQSPGALGSTRLAADAINASAAIAPYRPDPISTCLARVPGKTVEISEQSYWFDTASHSKNRLRSTDWFS